MAMKRIILTLVISLSLLTATAQMRTAYFMEGSYFRTDLNPALVPGRGYVAIPVLRAGLYLWLLTVSSADWRLRSALFRRWLSFSCSFPSSKTADTWHVLPSSWTAFSAGSGFPENHLFRSLFLRAAVYPELWLPVRLKARRTAV